MSKPIRISIFDIERAVQDAANRENELYNQLVDVRAWLKKWRKKLDGRAATQLENILDGLPPAEYSSTGDSDR